MLTSSASSVRLRSRLAVWACLVLALIRVGASAADLIANGDFQQWEQGLPVGWQAEVGATNGSGPESEISPLEPAGVVLSGNAQTARWRSLSQVLSLQPGKAYRLSFEARALDVQQEGQQFNNCYVGLFLQGAAPRPAITTATVDSAEWSPASLTIKAPADLKSARAMIFLSKSGRLEVKHVQLIELDANSSFQILVDDMDRHYSFFDAKGIDWPALVEKYRRPAEAAGSPDAFAKVIGRMLGELKDLHVTVRVGDGAPQMTYRRKFTANHDLPSLVKSLRNVQRFEPAGLVGRTREGYGYVAINSLAGDQRAFDQLLAAVESLRDAPAILIDLRPCTGGDERRALAIARLFNDQERVYARTLRRSGPKHDDLREQPPRMLPAAGSGPYTKPLIALIGPQCVSSGEGFAQMLAVLPNATLVGQPTAGASGNPAPVELPNGVTVMYSRWVDLLPDGAPLEGHGVPPDVVVPHKPLRGRDVTFEAAVAEATEQLK